MKQFKGTSGEWSYGLTRNTFIDVFEGDDYSVFNIDTDYGICRVASDIDDESDARLIAAAPELLEIVMHVRNCVENDGVYQPANLVHFNNIIAKALGE